MAGKFTILDFKKKKDAGEKITMLTAYDFPMAKILESAGVDSILVGDSLGMVVLGYDSTVKVTMDQMIHHAKAVKRAVKRAFLIGDMPFMSYQVNDEDAVRNAGRFIKEAGCDAVKIEGGRGVAERVKAITASGIAVLGHVGLTPQSVSKLGGYKVQGADQASADVVTKDAAEMEKAGCFALVLECVPHDLAARITKKLSIPTIGIGAGAGCDGQVLVTHDIVGYFDRFTPRFAKKYTDVNAVMLEAVKGFMEETASGVFPARDNSYGN